jgi:ligand-binding sensor domain-containing protein/class 3 adenylate cyclase/predicted metal-dependent HD superfamily phosphohydrolase
MTKLNKRNRIIKRALINLIRAFVFIGLLTAQAQQSIKFDNISLNEGLSQSTISAIIQDSQGYMWFGTQDGLNRYDGYRFKIYKHDPDVPTSISGNFIKCIIEDGDYLWIGTETGGLNRYEKSRDLFRTFDHIEQLRHSAVTALAKDKNGKIWIGTDDNGLISFSPKDGRVQHFNENNGLKSNNIKALKILAKGILLIGQLDGELQYLNTQESKPKTVKENKTYGSNFYSFEIAEKNQVLVGTDRGIITLQIENEEPVIKKRTYPVEQASSLLLQNDSTLWATTEGFGLFKIDLYKTKINNYRYDPLNRKSIAENLIFSVFQDRSGCIWIGTNNGLSKFDPIKQFFNHIAPEPDNPKGLNDKTIWAIAKDKRNRLWVATSKGLSRVDESTLVAVNYPFVGNNPNLPNNNNVYSILPEDDFLWLGTVDGFYKLNFSNDKLEKVNLGEFEQTADKRIYHITKDKNGNIWLGAKEGLCFYNVKDKTTLHFKSNPSKNKALPGRTVRAVHVDNKGNLWVGTEGGGLGFVSNDQITTQPKELSFDVYRASSADYRALNNNIITTILEDSDGTIWLGTYGGGLNALNPQTGKFRRYTEKEGLSNNVVYAILAENENALWMSTNFGLSRLEKATGAFKVFLEKDGLQSNEFNIGAAYRAKDGKLYFGGINGLNSFYSTQITENRIPPEVLITGILLFNQPIKIGPSSPLQTDVSFAQEITLKHKQNNLTIEYAALHFSNPANNKYKFILEGYEEQMNYVSDVKRAHYSNLPPGEYTFKVFGSNSDGIWSQSPAKLRIMILPPYYATWWFRGILGIVLLLIVYSFYQLRIRTIRLQKQKLSELVEKRTATIRKQKEMMEEQKQQLELEKEKSDKLLINILPAETAEELKNHGKATTRTYRLVTVMFTDIIGFTQIAEKMNPVDLVKRLDEYFREFDKIIERNKIEKIKTIGDSYMAAGGVPIRNKENPVYTVLAALQIQSFMRIKKDEVIVKGEIDPWDLRIGIHTGDVIAGVIGEKRIAYDIWGNTVNVASRMESSGMPGKVNISGATYEHIKPYFDVVYRGKIMAKNKGHIDMYFVDRIKPELSDDEEGTIPNAKFWEYLNLHVFSSINYQKAERHIMKILVEKLSPNLHYHGIHHTADVVQAVERIAIMEGVVDEHIFVLKSAATYHDAGFVEQYEHNEPVGAKMAEEILPLYGYTKEQIQQVKELIYATIIPHNPKNKLEEIICDADLDYLGRDDFHDIADSLRRELRDHGKINSDRLWDEIQVKFLTAHKYFTDSAKNLRDAKKQKHLEEIKQRLIENNYKD